MFEQISHNVHWSTRKKIQSLIDSQKIYKTKNHSKYGFPYNPELSSGLDDQYDALIDEIKLAFDIEILLFINKFESIVFMRDGGMYWYYPTSDTLWTSKN